MRVAIVRKKVLVRGRVQGVAFRAYTVREAAALGVSGWVRNLDDGRVEAEVEGDAAAVERLVAWMRRGPRLARVDGLDVVDDAPRGETGELKQL